MRAEGWIKADPEPVRRPPFYTLKVKTLKLFLALEFSRSLRRPKDLYLKQMNILDTLRRQQEYYPHTT
jgi:hypothetical protein